MVHLNKNQKSAAIETLFLYIFALAVFYFEQKGMNIFTYKIMAGQALVPSAVFYYLQRLHKKTLFSRMWIFPLIIGLAWFVLVPALYGVSTGPYESWNPRREILFGLYLMLFFAETESLYALLKYKVSSFIVKCLSLLFSLFFFIILIIPIAEVGHFFLYHVPLTEHSLYAIQVTDLKEACGYIQTYVPPPILAVTVLLFLGILIFTYKSFLQISPLPFSKKAAVIIILIPVIGRYLWVLKDKTTFFDTWNQVVNYRELQNLFTRNYEERYNAFHLDTDRTLAQTNPGSVIVVIGESASRDYMKIYNPDFPYEDTPWLENQKKNPDFIIYDHVYTSWNQTVQSLMMACTEMSQYNNKQFNESITMIDVAKKAGYYTSWFTRQGGFGKWEAPISLIMKTADSYESPITYDQLHYDQDLVSLLKKVKNGQNNFIVIHLVGSHVPYKSDYPKENTIFDSSNLLGNYANTILYTDTVLKNIYDYARQNLNLKAMIYFSDHGENPKRGHGPNVRSFDTLRIPMFIYLSPDFQITYPKKAALLKKRTHEYFTNDMVYNTICGILNAPSNHYDSKEDLSSLDYHFNLNNLWTFQHTLQINKDPLTTKKH